uniref:enhancer of mRNA-decapping protein 4-like isoform X1 n=1 Tax=Styela clava TaxID=7725 RepID=UPI0019393391|nr:enhancer of mRNA-decapping protein 4-like isoform X1 [Styela clava]
MDLSNGKEEESADVLTNQLKGMLKINGNSGDSEIQESEPSPKTENSEVDSKKDAVEEEPSGSLDVGGSQRIDLSQVKDGECVSIYGDQVSIITSGNADMEADTSGSDKVRISPITKFEWEHKYYPGTLVSVTNDYTAYAIKSRSYAVRVISRKNTSDRLLLRGFTAPVCDVAFAHPTSSLISAVDEEGNFIIWQLSQNGDSTMSTKKLHVKSSDPSASLYHRLVWLTYMHCEIDGTNPEEELLKLDDDTEADPLNQRRLLVVTHGNIVEIWDINCAFEIAHDDENETDRSKLSSTFMTIKGHDDVITDCELSPEGSVVAVASHDGYVKFWQVSIESTEEPTCLHRWKPHGDRPVSLVTFCDDRKQPQLVLYWRFMLTGCSQNNELKIWCTVSWTCLQTITFESPPVTSSSLPALKCGLHAASDYLIVSDINRKVMYVMGCVTDLEQGRASLNSIAQYFLTTPLLSFAIVDAQKYKFKNLVAMDEEETEDRNGEQAEAAHDSDDENSDDDDGENNTDKQNNDVEKRINGVLIKLVSIHTKSLQSLDIRFIPNTLANDDSMGLSTYNTVSDELNIVSVDESLSVISPSLDNGQSMDDLMEVPQQEEEDEEEGDSSKNKTALTANEGDQSTLLAVDETDMTEKDEMQESAKSVAEPISLSTNEPIRTTVMDLVGDVTDELPVAHSSPSGGRQYSMQEDSLNRGQGEGEASASPDKPDSHPVLLTPEAFTSSLKKPDDLVSVDSTFTHVTPFSVDHPSLFGSEINKSMQESTHQKSPLLPTSSSITPPPPTFPSSVSASGNVKGMLFKSPELESPKIQSTTPLVSLSTSQASIEMGPTSSYHSILHSLPMNEPGPFGDVQNTRFMMSKSKDKSPDLISSASTIENVIVSSSEARVLIGGPLAGAVGGSGDSLFMTGHPKVSQDFDAESIGSNTSKKSSSSMPPMSSAPWPKAPDVTMSRPSIRKPTNSSTTRDDFLRASDLSQSQVTVRPDSVLHADQRADDQIKPQSSYNAKMGADLLAAIVNLQKQQEDLMKSHQKEINKKTNQIMKNVDVALKKFDQQQNEKLERALKSMSDSQRKFQAETRANMASANEQAVGKMERSIKHEVKNTVLPGLSRSLDPLKDQLHSSFAQKLTATDSVLKDSLGKLVRSKETVEAIGNSTGRAIQSQVHSAFRDSFTQIVVPMMEKSCNNMFVQLSTVFQKGMDEVVLKLEKQIQSRVKVDLDRLQSTEKQAREATAELRDVAGHARTKITTAVEQDMRTLINSEMKSAQETLIAEMSKSFQRQNELALKEQKALLTQCIRTTMAEMPIQQHQIRTKLPGDKTNHPSTPGRSPGPLRPTFEMQQQAILNLLHQGNLNSAFQRALTASDLALVMYVCETVDPAIVFGTVPCPLHQPILLSLIQQLSCDLGRNTTTKMKYLQEAVMNLDSSHQVTQEHMQGVLEALVKNLEAHVATLVSSPTDASNTPVIKQMRMLAMAAKSLI